MGIKNNLKFGVNRTLNRFIRKEKVAMFHIGRCGSTVLADMLNQHNDIFWANEIFNSFHNKTNYEMNHNIDFAENLIRRGLNRNASKIFGFETRYLPLQDIPFLINADLKQYVDLLLDLGFKKFIILYRKNLLKRAVSFEVSKKSNNWHRKINASEPFKISFNPHRFPDDTGINDLIESISFIEGINDKLKKIIGAGNFLELSYEDDIQNDPYIAYEKVCDYLQINYLSPNIQYKKTNPFSLKEILYNYDEVTEYFENSSYEWMIK